MKLQSHTGLTLLAAILVIFTALLDPWLSMGLAVLLLVGGTFWIQRRSRP
jgi:hypothetical protein